MFCIKTAFNKTLWFSNINYSTMFRFPKLDYMNEKKEKRMIIVITALNIKHKQDAM